MPNFSNIPNILIYYSQELAHFGPEVSVVYGVLAHFETKIHENFALNQVFMYNCLCLTALIFPKHILFPREIDTCWPKKSDKKNS